MLSQKIKRVISVLLIVSMTFTSGGFSVLADAVDDVVESNENGGSQNAVKNYYLEYKEYEERTVIVTTKNSDDSLGAEGNNDGSVENKNQIVSASGEDESPSLSVTNNDDDTENEGYATEPEEDENSLGENNSSNEEENSAKENTTTANENTENENGENTST